MFGTKILVALLAGALGMPPAKFYRVNLAASAAWATATALLGYAFATSFEHLRGAVLRAEFGLLILFILLGIITLLWVNSSAT